MDDLNKLSANGGNDLYTAGTYKFLSLNVATLTLSSATSAGTATVTANGLAKVATWDTSLAVTAANFVGTNYDAYAAINLILSYSGNTIIFTSAKAGLTVNVTIVNLTTDLTGTVAYSKNEGSDIATFTPSGSSGSALITVNSISRVITYDTSWDHTINTHFVSTNAAAYAAIGIVLTGSVSTLIFTANSGVTITKAVASSLVTNSAAAVVKTVTRLPHPVYALNVFAEAVLTSYKYLDKNGVVIAGGKKFIGVTLTEGSPVIVLEYPAVELVIASGTLSLNFIK
jgi:hypothetical protein